MATAVSGLLFAQVATARGEKTGRGATSGTSGRSRCNANRTGDGIAGVVLHYMDAAHPAELLEEEPERILRIRGDELLLGDGLTARRIFERLI